MSPPVRTPPRSGSRPARRSVRPDARRPGKGRPQSLQPSRRSAQAAQGKAEKPRTPFRRARPASPLPGGPGRGAPDRRPARALESSTRDEAPTSKLQKRLAEAGLGSRRAMEELILSGQVSVNGRVARIGARVGPGDRIAIAGEPLSPKRTRRMEREPRVVLYHKAEGEIVSRNDPEGRPSVFDRVPIVQRGRWLAVGRLDFNTCGLLVFTDSGELANRLTHPRFQQPRDYAVRIVGELAPEQVRSLRGGIALEDGPARFELLEAQGGEGTNRWYRVRVREGRNRLVRRMFAAVGMTVSRLMRTRFGPFELPPRIKRGQWLRLDAAEVQRVLQQLQAQTPDGAPRQAGRRLNRPRVPPATANVSVRRPHHPRRPVPAR